MMLCNLSMLGDLNGKRCFHVVSLYCIASSICFLLSTASDRKSRRNLSSGAHRLTVTRTAKVQLSERKEGSKTYHAPLQLVPIVSPL